MPYLRGILEYRKTNPSLATLLSMIASSLGIKLPTKGMPSKSSTATPEESNLLMAPGFNPTDVDKNTFDQFLDIIDRPSNY